MIKENIGNISTSKNIELLTEPSDLFQNYCSQNWLQLLSDAPCKIPMIQSMICSILCQFYREKFAKIKSNENTIIVTERYMTSAEVFIHSLREQGFIDRLDEIVLEKLLDNYISFFPSPSSIFYLSRSTNWSMKYIAIRSRQEEISFCTSNYIESISKYYELYLKKMKENGVNIVTCFDLDIYQVFLQFKKLIETL